MSTVEFSYRIRYIVLTVISVFVTGYLLLIFIEGLHPLDALYFIIVTVSTVGYGDLTPTNPFSKMIVSVLIITGIASLALISERFLDRIIKMSTQLYLHLPEDDLEYTDHVIIVGFTKIAENVALLFQERFFRVVILDPHTVAVERARQYGFEAYYGRPEIKKVLSGVNIKEAAALYLFMNDENRNVLTSIQARSMNQDLLIYAETDHELSIEIGNLIGIDRTYHYERIVASNIPISIRRITALVLPNQMLSELNKYIMVIVSQEFSYKDKFDQFHIIGFVNRTFTRFRTLDDFDINEALELGYYLLIAVPLTVFENAGDQIDYNTIVLDEKQSSISDIIIGGYGEVAQHVINEMDENAFEGLSMKILCFTKEEADKAENDGFDVILCPRENLAEQIEHHCQRDTLIINLFERITDSLLINTASRKVGAKVSILQIANSKTETDVFIRSNADRILIPEILMSRGMFLIFISTKKLINSIIWSNAHIFEHYIDEFDPLIGLSIVKLHERGYEVLLHDPGDEVVIYPTNGTVNKGDHLIMFKRHEFLKKSEEQIIDPSHT